MLKQAPATSWRQAGGVNAAYSAQLLQLQAAIAAARGQRPAGGLQGYLAPNPALLPGQAGALVFPSPGAQLRPPALAGGMGPGLQSANEAPTGGMLAAPALQAGYAAAHAPAAYLGLNPGPNPFQGGAAASARPAGAAAALGVGMPAALGAAGVAVQWAPTAPQARLGFAGLLCAAWCELLTHHQLVVDRGVSTEQSLSRSQLVPCISRGYINIYITF